MSANKRKLSDVTDNDVTGVDDTSIPSKKRKMSSDTNINAAIDLSTSPPHDTELQSDDLRNVTINRKKRTHRQPLTKSATMISDENAMDEQHGEAEDKDDDDDEDLLNTQTSLTERARAHNKRSEKEQKTQERSQSRASDSRTDASESKDDSKDESKDDEHESMKVEASIDEVDRTKERPELYGLSLQDCKDCVLPRLMTQIETFIEEHEQAIESNVEAATITMKKVKHFQSAWAHILLALAEHHFALQFCDSLFEGVSKIIATMLRKDLELNGTSAPANKANKQMRSLKHNSNKEEADSDDDDDDAAKQSISDESLKLIFKYQWFWNKRKKQKKRAKVKKARQSMSNASNKDEERDWPSYLDRTVGGWLGSFIQKEFNINLECATMMVLFTIACILIGRYKKTNTYSIYLNLFLIIAGTPAACKSPPMSKLISFQTRWIEWITPLLKKIRGGTLPDDATKQFMDACGSFSRLAKKAEETNGVLGLYFDEVGIYQKIFNVNENGKASEETGSLTKIYDCAGLARSFNDDQYTCKIDRCVWSMMMVGQYGVIGNLLRHHEDSGFLARNLVVDCVQHSGKYHANGQHYSTSKWNDVSEVVFHSVFTCILNAAGADTMRSRLSAGDFHLMFSCTARTEIYMHVYELIILLTCNDIAMNPADYPSNSSGLATALKKSTVQCAKLTGLLQATEYYATKEDGVHTVTQEWVTEKVQPRPRDKIVEIDNPYNCLAAMELLTKSVCALRRKILNSDEDVKIKKRFLTADQFVQVFESIEEEELQELLVCQYKGESRASSLNVSDASTAIHAKTQPVIPATVSEELEMKNSNKNSNEEESVEESVSKIMDTLVQEATQKQSDDEMKTDSDDKFAEKLTVFGGLLAFAGPSVNISTMTTQFQWRKNAMEQHFGFDLLDYDDFVAEMHAEITDSADENINAKRTAPGVKTRRKLREAINRAVMVASGCQCGWDFHMHSKSRRFQGVSNVFFKYPIEQLERWLAWKRQEETSESELEEQQEYDENEFMENDELLEFFKFLAISKMTVSTYIAIYKMDEDNKAFVAKAEVDAATTTERLEAARKTAMKKTELKPKFNPALFTSPTLVSLAKELDSASYDIEDHMWQMELKKQAMQNSAPHLSPRAPYLCLHEKVSSAAKRAKNIISGVFNTKTTNTGAADKLFEEQVDIRLIPLYVEKIVKDKRIVDIVEAKVRATNETAAAFNAIHPNLDKFVRHSSAGSRRINGVSHPLSGDTRCANLNTYPLKSDKAHKEADAKAKKANK